MSVATVSVPPGTVESDLPALLAEPAAALRRGGLVAFPTETVYGLGSDAMNRAAVARAYRAKKRPADNPVIVHLPHLSWLDRIAEEVGPTARRLAEEYWPGPLTLVLTARDDVPRETTGGLPTIAVRVPAHPLARCLIETAGTPVAAPSANVSGRPSPTIAAHVLADLDRRIDWIVDGGACAVGIESTVVDVRTDRPVVLREGIVTREMLGAGSSADQRPGAAVSPGTRHTHYRPDARVIVAPMTRGAALAERLSQRHSVGLVAPEAEEGQRAVTVLARPLGATELGRVLYGALRDADRLGLDVVVVEAVPEDGVGRAVMDRLYRAAGLTDR